MSCLLNRQEIAEKRPQTELLTTQYAPKGAASRRHKTVHHIKVSLLKVAKK